MSSSTQPLFSLLRDVFLLSNSNFSKMYSKTFSFFKVVVKHTYHKRHFSYFLSAQFINCFYSVGFVKNPPANAGNMRDMGSIPGLGKSLEEGMSAHSSTLAWRIPRTQEPGGYSPQGCTELDTTERLSIAAVHSTVLAAITTMHFQNFCSSQIETLLEIFTSNF